MLQDFVTAGAWEPPTLTCGGSTPMGDAISQSLDMVFDRKRTYQTNAIQYFRP